MGSSQPLKQGPDISLDLKHCLAELNFHWKDEFCGVSLVAMKQMIYTNQALQLQHEPYYAKLIPIIQSSGMGKSRLIDEIGKSHLCITVTLRENGESGYPPGDPEITKFLKEPLKAPKDVLMAHTYMLALLDSIFCYITDWIQNQTYISDEKTLACLWHDMMASRSIWHSPTDFSSDLSTVIAATRSDERKRFCEKVVQDARTTVLELNKNEQWTMFFNNKDEVFSFTLIHSLLEIFYF